MSKVRFMLCADHSGTPFGLPVEPHIIIESDCADVRCRKGVEEVFFIAASQGFF